MTLIVNELALSVVPVVYQRYPPVDAHYPADVLRHFNIVDGDGDGAGDGGDGDRDGRWLWQLMVAMPA